MSGKGLYESPLYDQVYFTYVSSPQTEMFKIFLDNFFRENTANVFTASQITQ